MTDFGSQIRFYGLQINIPCFVLALAPKAFGRPCSTVYDVSLLDVILPFHLSHTVIIMMYFKTVAMSLLSTIASQL